MFECVLGSEKLDVLKLKYQCFMGSAFLFQACDLCVAVSNNSVVPWVVLAVECHLLMKP